MSTPLDNDPKPTSSNGRCPECGSLIFKKMAETKNTVECYSCRLIHIRLTGCEAFRYESKRKGRPTPETDAVFMTIAVGDFIDPHKDALRFARDQCEELECQRDEARAELERVTGQAGLLRADLEICQKQRDRLLDALKIALEYMDNDHLSSNGPCMIARHVIAEVKGSR